MFLFQVWRKYIGIEFLIVRDLNLVLGQTELPILKSTRRAAGQGCYDHEYIEQNSFHLSVNIQIYRNMSDSQNFRQKICEFDISLQR